MVGCLLQIRTVALLTKTLIHGHHPYERGESMFLIESVQEIKNEEYPIMRSCALVECPVSFIRFIRELYSYVGLIEPIVIAIGLFNIKDFGLYGDSDQRLKQPFIGPPFGFNVWSKTHLKITPSQVGYFDDRDQIAQRFADRIWNAFGYEKAPHFDEKGNFKP